MEISIIVPIYKAEKTLKRCVDSILEQTFDDFELLLIDDGSPDKSGEICDEYARSDSRVRVFHKENGGVSSARNLGLDNARGKWVMFVDSDDELSSKFSDVDVSLFRDDMVAFPPVVVKANGERERFSFVTSDCKYVCFDFAPLLCTYIIRTPWAKFYKRSAIGQLRFDTNLRFGEDFVFNMQFLKRAESFRYDNTKSFYLYYDAPIDFYGKYAMSIEESVATMVQLFDAYWSLEVKNEEFERTYFLMMKRLCQTAIYKNPQAWFRAPKVKSIYKNVKHLMPLAYRINYWLMSHQCVNVLRRSWAKKQAL